MIAPSTGGSNNDAFGQNSNPFDDHNQLGILRESLNQGSSNNQPVKQSAYARVRHIKDYLHCKDL